MSFSSSKLQIKVGDKHNKLTFLKLNVKWKTTFVGAIVWLSKFRCDCGNICYYSKSNVVRGNNKDCGCVGTKRRKNIGIRIIISSYKSNAKKKCLVWMLTVQEVKSLLAGKCFYCGIVPEKRIINADRNYKATCNGIDRIDSSIGYVLSNCVSCCKFCNRAKNILSASDFLANISRIQEYQYNKVSLSLVA